MPDHHQPGSDCRADGCWSVLPHPVQKLSQVCTHRSHTHVTDTLLYCPAYPGLTCPVLLCLACTALPNAAAAAAPTELSDLKDPEGVAQTTVALLSQKAPERKLQQFLDSKIAGLWMQCGLI
jgi:hypothetical protein